MSELMQADYRGNAMMIIRETPQDKFPFQFGTRKAHLILEHIEEIRKFAQAHPLAETASVLG